MNGVIVYEHHEGAFCLCRLPYKDSALAYISLTSAVPHLSLIVPFWADPRVHVPDLFHHKELPVAPLLLSSQQTGLLLQ